MVGASIGRSRTRRAQRAADRGPCELVRWALVVLLSCGGVASAEEPREPRPLAIPGVSTSDAPSSSGTTTGEIDSLLKLPSGYLEPRGRVVAGAGEDEWRRRFDRANEALDRAQARLDETKRELDEVAGTGGASQWSVAPPGASSAGGPTNSPLSFKLRQDLLRNREALDAAEKALKDLRIEADLAGVPVAWRGDGNRPIPRRIPEDPR